MVLRDGWECYNCKYVLEPKLGKNRKKIWRCQKYPDAIPEIAYVPKGLPKNSKFDHYDPIKEGCKYFTDKEPTEIEKRNHLEAKKFTILALKEFKKEKKEKYNFTAPECQLLEEVLIRLDKKSIEQKVRKCGLHYYLLEDIIEEINSNLTEEEHQQFLDLILEPDPRSVSNIIGDAHFIEQILGDLEPLYGEKNTQFCRTYYYCVGDIETNLCRIYLKNKYYKISSPDVERKCKICGRPFFSVDNKTNETYLSFSEISDSILEKSLFPGLKDINDIDICSRHYTLGYPKDYYDRTIFKSRDEMVDDLKKLYTLLGYLPPRNFHSKQFIRGLNHERNRALEIIAHINTMYPYEITQPGMKKNYKTIFGEWISVLKGCNLIDDAIVRLNIGYSCIAKDGHSCNSLVEKIIDDFFYENNISHDKEPHYPYDEQFNPYEMLRADWLINKRCYVEYFGLSEKEEYKERMERKFSLVEKLNLDFLAIYPGEEYQIKFRLSEFFK